MRTFGIGLVGYGGIGRVHALAYRAIPYYYGLPAETVRVVGVATTRIETAQKAAAEIGCEFYTDDLNALLAHPGVDIIDCCTPNNQHEAILTAAAAAGKHLYCDKPLAITTAQGERIAAAAAAAGVQTGLTFNNRFYPAVMRARQLAEDGFLGRVFHFRGRYFRSGYIDASKPLTWRLDKSISGGGALLDLGSHVLDLLYYLLGDFASVSATMETLIPQRPVAAGSSELGDVSVDDLAFLQLRMGENSRAAGAIGTVEVSRMATGAANELAIEIYGDGGSICFDSTDPSWLEIYDARDPDRPMGGTRGLKRVETVQRYDGQKAPDWTMPPDFMRTHAECQFQFLKALDEGRTPSPSFAEGLHVQAVMEAAERSASTGRWVEVSELLPGERGGGS